MCVSFANGSHSVCVLVSKIMQTSGVGRIGPDRPDRECSVSAPGRIGPDRGGQPRTESIRGAGEGGCPDQIGSAFCKCRRSSAPKPFAARRERQNEETKYQRDDMLTDPEQIAALWSGSFRIVVYAARAGPDRPGSIAAACRASAVSMHSTELTDRPGSTSFVSE